MPMTAMRTKTIFMPYFFDCCKSRQTGRTWAVAQDTVDVSRHLHMFFPLDERVQVSEIKE